MNKSLVVLSGGQDSVTCLGVALKDSSSVEAISFKYGQRHVVELQCATELCQNLGIPHRVVDLSFYSSLVTSALITEDQSVSDNHPRMKNLPASFVPNRNALFLTIAHAAAQEIGADRIYTGVCQTDYSGYPDCREGFILRLEETLNVGYETSIRIMTPMMHLTKAETFALAEQVGFLEIVIEHSHTCYNGDHTTRHEWGYGCGKCPACQLREKGWNEFKQQKDQ